MSQESKFNFEEEQVEETQVAKEAVRQDAKSLWHNTKTFLVNLFGFRKDTDRDATIEAIKNDIPFKGATSWILICSIFVASVGLNANSTAVVIGAMLISPLMGPILGIGMSIAINDIDTLRRSLINFAVMVVLSVLTAFLFFWLFPLREDSSELLARTRPDIRDVLIAFFGGLALIIARTKRGTIASVIFGVAIATALMPPLCTVGYGLAKAALGEGIGLNFAAGAIYLFLINTVFIALATFLVLKFLRFPMIRYANSAKRKRIARIASFFAILAMVPAAFTFINVLNESRFRGDAKRFISNELEGLPNSAYIQRYATFSYKQGEEPSTIELTSFGDDRIPESTLSILRSRLKDYSALGNTQIMLNQSRNSGLDQMKYMKELRYRDSLDLMSQTQKITFLEGRVALLSRFEEASIPFQDISNEAKVNYEHLVELSYANIIRTNFSKVDTVLRFSTKWKDSAVTQEAINVQQQKLAAWLKLKLGDKKFEIQTEE